MEDYRDGWDHFTPLLNQCQGNTLLGKPFCEVGHPPLFLSAPELRAALSAGKMSARTSMVLASQWLFLVLRLGTWTGRYRE